MKKVFFAAFAGACVMTSIMATTPGAGKIKSSQKINQVLRDTVPPTDTTKMNGLVVLRDTVPPNDTTKIQDFVVLRDTVPPTDTSKIAMYAVVLRDTIPGKKDTTHRPHDTTSMPRMTDLASR